MDVKLSKSAVPVTSRSFTWQFPTLFKAAKVVVAAATEVVVTPEPENKKEEVSKVEAAPASETKKEETPKAEAKKEEAGKKTESSPEKK